MKNGSKKELQAMSLEEIENKEWLESLDYVLQSGGSERVIQLLQNLEAFAFQEGVSAPFSANTPYYNSIPVQDEPAFPANREIERRIKSIIRWNAMAMVVRTNRDGSDVGGHISTFASVATLFEIGFNHFFRAKGWTEGFAGDQIYFQGHASPGIYARAFLEGRLSATQLENFRKELDPKGGLSSYPHPWLMPDFWSYPTVSMGLGPIMAIYHARFNRYMEDRSLKEPKGEKIWAFLGDGETDEPEALGAISLAAREKLDNLIFVINCNMQRLDGPVRGNGKIMQELERSFRGAGWNVIKVVWGSDWDPIFAQDKQGKMRARLGEIVDGWYQKYSVEDGSFIRDHITKDDPDLKELFSHLTDDDLRKLRRGGHDPAKIFAAYKSAVEHKGQPTVILAKTIKGYGLGETGEGKNITHQQKKLNENELKEFRTRFGIPISDDDVAGAPFYKPDDNSPEMRYLRAQREKLGGFLPARTSKTKPLKALPASLFNEFLAGTEGREASTTMVFVRILSKLLKQKESGKFIVPIVPDEARTFGMEALFRQYGIYSHIGQIYEPVDSDSLLYYKEAKDGQILEEGITEAGGMSSFIAAGTAYANWGVNTIPFFIYYSMFGMQRIGDLAWAAGDMRCRGFMIGATSGRTTLNGEGLQHQDGHSHLLAYPIPNMIAYDPAFAYEVSIIIQNGIKRMYQDQEDIFYYITVTNEGYAHPQMPEGSEEGILKGLYRFQKSSKKGAKCKASLFGSGAILKEVIKAGAILEEKYDVAADIWSITSYKELHKDGTLTDRHNLLHPNKKPRVPYLTECLQGETGPFIIASDYVKALPHSVAQYFPKPPAILGTDGFGRSASRKSLRDFFEISTEFVVFTTLTELVNDGKMDKAILPKAMKELGIDPQKPNPLLS